MRHSKRWLPVDSAAMSSRWPAGTNRRSPIGLAGAVPGGSAALSGGTTPVPKFFTSVKVCVSPPRLLSWSRCPGRRWIWPGLNRQALRPPSAGLTKLRNVWTGTPLVRRVQTPSPNMALNVAGSQRSMICTLRTVPAAADPGAAIASAARETATTPILRERTAEGENRLEPILAPLGEGRRDLRRGAAPEPAHANRAGGASRGSVLAGARGRFPVHGGRHAELAPERLGELGGLPVADGEGDVAYGALRVRAHGRRGGAQTSAEMLAAEGAARLVERPLQRSPRREDPRGDPVELQVERVLALDDRHRVVVEQSARVARSGPVDGHDERQRQGGGLGDRCSAPGHRPSVPFLSREVSQSRDTWHRSSQALIPANAPAGVSATPRVSH